MKKNNLQEALDRYNRINSYVINLKEQVTPPADGAAPPPPAEEDPNAVPPADPAAEAPAPPPTDAPPPPDANTLPPTPDQQNAMTDPAPEAAPMEGSDVEGLDVTELVNMQREIKSKLDSQIKNNEEAVHKMDTVFSKLDDLAVQIQNMDQILSKIDDLESKVNEMKPITPEEKLNLRSYDSYPFNQKLTDFFADKQPQMKATGKNEYVLQPEDLNYTKDDIADSFT